MTEFSPRECRIGDRRFLLREVVAQDRVAVLDLFVRVFGEMPPATWYEWKYGVKGLNGKAYGLWEETGRLVAHFAGFPRLINWCGKQIAALQIGDMMVAPEARGELTRRGPLYQVCSAFFARWVGVGRPYALAFGFTHERAMRLIEILGLFVKVGTIQRLVWSPDSARLPWGWKMTNVASSAPDFDRIIALVWRKMEQEGEKHILGMRNATHVRARFVARPGMRHRFLLISRRWFGPCAVVIVRDEGNSVLRWLDFVGPRAALPAAAAAVRRVAAEVGVAEVETWASAAAQADLLATGAQPAGTASHLALAQASCCPDDSLASKGWWLSGDTDFL